MSSKTKEFVKKDKYIVFYLNQQYFGLKIDDIKSIEKLQTITRVPGTPSFIKGVINLRGFITPVIDLKKRYQIDSFQESDQTRIIILESDNTYIGLIVDGCSEVVDIAEKEIQPTPEVIGEVSTDFIEGVIDIDKRLINLINVEKTIDKTGVLETILYLHKKI